MQNTTNNKATNKGIQVQAPTLPKGGGTVQGMGETFAPNAFNGSSGMSIPIPTTACRGFEPQLSLNYSSGNGNSAFGQGWELSTPEITRRTSLKVPAYNDTDTFLYTAGDYLVPRCTEKGEAISYTTHINSATYTVTCFMLCKEEAFDKIERYISNTDPTDDFWKVSTSDNTVSIFGKSAAAKIYDPQNPTHIFKWLLEETYNDKGDHQVYVYLKENSDQVPTTIAETNRDQQSQTYLSSVYYGNDAPLTEGSLVLGETETLLDAITWNFQITLDYGVYSIVPLNPNPHITDSGKTWLCRQDPFSDYRSGFEIRTYRLCRNILLFHRFTELADHPVLVSALQLEYKETPLFTQLISATHTGYRYDSVKAEYEWKRIPELQFSYTEFQPLLPGYVAHNFEQPVNTNLQNIAQAGNAIFYQLIDLFGEGIPGILYQDGESVYYRSAVEVKDTGVVYSDPAPVDFPNADKFSSQHLLSDISGNGRLDLTFTNMHSAGYWEMTDQHLWSRFTAFESFPSNYHYPLNNQVDVTGDGVADIVLISDDTVQYNASLGSGGFAAMQQASNVSQAPSGTFPSPTQALFYADIIGSGLSQRVQVTQNTIACWPNLGYGNFGPQVLMDSVPDFGPDFDTTRLLWADINGSGLVDMAYIYASHINIYFNLSGNGFSSTPLSIPFPANWDNLSQVSFADVKGNGTNCLVFTQTHPQPNIWYYDFNLYQKEGTVQSQKPYLLCGMDNNMGALTQINYASSTQSYLKDKQGGNNWITCLPFPVNVIQSITHSDQISLSTTSTFYSYHHGYYDSEEKAFRGFGRVETIDSESFEQYLDQQNEGALSVYQSPDSFTRTWYHTGAFSEHKTLIAYYLEEFWQGDTEAPLLDYAYFKFLTNHPQSETQRDACRTLYGTVIRSEVYGCDGTQWEKTPYSVTESEFEVKEIQELFHNRYSAFVLHLRQSMAYDYERNANDPRISHEFILVTDFYGHILQSASVHYPRRSVNIPATTDTQTSAQQTQLRVAYTSHHVFNSNQANHYWGLNSSAAQVSSEGYLLGISIENKAYEITGLAPDTKGYFSWHGIQKQISEALQATNGVNLLHWNRDYYYNASEQQESPLGTITVPVLPSRSEFMEFDITSLQSQFNDCLTADQLTQLLTGTGINGAHGGYSTYPAELEAANYYWNQGSRLQYHQLPFFLPSGVCDALGNVHTYQYDPYLLFVQLLTDPLQNRILVSEYDYQAMQPITIIDSNNNSSSVLIDPLGVVIATTRNGHQAGETIGFAPLSGIPPVLKGKLNEAFENPASMLTDPDWMQAESIFCYDLYAWKNTQTPIHFKTITRNYFVNPEPPVATSLYHLEVVYQDGFGRTTQHKSYYEGANQWQTSGAVRYNNKGQIAEQFDPRFEVNASYILQTNGCSTLLFYDALGRNVLTKRYHATQPNAEDFFTKTLFGNIVSDTETPTYYGYLNNKLYGSLGSTFQPSAWCSLQYDENDCIADSTYQPVTGNNVDPYAWAKAQVFANTPVLRIEDNIRKVVQHGQLNVTEAEQNNTYFTFDILGDELTSADQRLHPQGLNNFTHSYSLSKTVIKTVAADAGTQWLLHDVMGNIAFTTDSRQTQQFFTYDALNRFSTLYVSNATLSLAQTTRAVIYGDSMTNATPYFINHELLNLRGKPVVILDEAGLYIHPSYDVNGEPLLNAQWIKSDYQNEANWNSISNTVYNELIVLFQGEFQPSDFQNLLLPQAFTNLLNSTAYVTSAQYNAVGELTLSIDADGNKQYPQYYSNGWIKGLNTAAGTTLNAANPNATTPEFSNVQYNANRQRTSLRYGNRTGTVYTYDTYSWELTGIKTQRYQNLLGNSILQDLQYHHDPVGNISSKQNDIASTVFYGNQSIVPLSSYTYDSLYRLVKATGREHQGMWKNVQSNQNKLASQPLSNPLALQNYTQQYTYDASNNLVQLQQLGNNAYTRTNTIATTSNQLLTSQVGNGTASPTIYDTNGNMLSLDGCASITWNYHNNMQSAVLIDRGNVMDNDAEYYVYNAAGRRVRKVFRQKTQNGWQIRETLYAGGIEIRKGYTEASTTIDKEWHSVNLEDGTNSFCIWQYWVSGALNPEEKKVKLRYQLTDLLNSSCCELDEDAKLITYEEYYPYGGTSLMTSQNEQEVKSKHYHYSFKEKDNTTGLYYYGMRYYAPWLGRWTCTDPAGTIDGLNVYAFVEGNPTTDVDVGGMAGKKTAPTKKTNSIVLVDGEKVGINAVQVPLYSRLIQTKLTPKIPFKDKSDIKGVNKRKKQKGNNKKTNSHHPPGYIIPPNSVHVPRNSWPKKLIAERETVEKSMKKKISPQKHKRRAEILHMIAHHHGGKEESENATAGSSHANTEDIAFDTAVDFYRNCIHKNGVQMSPNIKVTHYPNDKGGLWSSRRKLYLSDENGNYQKVIDHVADGQRGDIGKKEFNALLKNMINSHWKPYTNLPYKLKTPLKKVT